MAAARFVHLRLHTEYSIVDGIARVEDAVAAAAADGMPALAITDSANLFGAIKFFEAARARGVQPVIGCDLWVENPRHRDKPYRVTALCRNQAGYLALCDLLTRAYAENHWRGRAQLKREWLKGVSGLIVLSGAEAGEVGAALAASHLDEADRIAREWTADFPDAFYIEIQRVDAGRSERLIAASLALAERCGLPVVATHPVQFIRATDFRAHEARVCIAQGYVLGDSRRPREFAPSQYFKTQAEMAELFADLPEALENSVEIARRCAFEFALGKSRLPAFPTPKGESIDAFLRAEARRGLDERLARLYPDEARRAEARLRYAERLTYELDVIIQMGFPGYFLIVADFIHWAKTHGVPVGPGRGSGAGSLVAYSLGITDLDPLRYELLFERFLNPERVSMPDFDIDFCQDGRDRVIEYVRGKYGEASVAQIATFGTLAARAVVRDVGRVLDLGFTTLTVLDWAERYVRGMGDADFSLARVPLDDADTYKLLSAGNTTAVFQLESRGMRDLIKRARPDRFEDVIALVALYRPGPMDLIPEYIERKHGKRVDYLDPRLEPILGPTYGIMVYQEQVMQIAQVIGGYTLGSADLLRRAMGKKKPEEMAPQRDIFVAGAQKNGLSRSKATQLFDLMEKFAGYGFNKSHAAAYALLAYQTAYMKAHHRAAFLAANLSAVMDDTDKVRQFYEDALANGLAILPPDINASGYRFTPVHVQRIRYGLGAVRGTGAAAIEAIVLARREAVFTDVFDFCRRVDKRHLNRRVVEALVRAGAFDSLDAQRSKLLASVGRALEAAEQAERAASQSSLFGEAEAPRGGIHAYVDL